MERTAVKVCRGGANDKRRELMSNKKKSTGLWRGLTSVSASLLAVTVGASAIVDTNAAFINARLGISSYKIVDTSNGEKQIPLISNLSSQALMR